MYNSEALQEKWQPVLNHPDLPEITDSYKRAVTAVILENQEKELKEQRTLLTEEGSEETVEVSGSMAKYMSAIRKDESRSKK